MIDGRRLTIVTAILICSVSLASYAGGTPEDPIRQARELVAENRINEAILLLEQTVRDDPDRILEAEALMRTIREIRGEYNVLFEQLIDNLVNNPDDLARTLEIIDTMEELDEFPNERVVQQIRDARIVAQLAFDRSLVDEAMDEARQLVAEAQYTAAVARYLTVRELQRDRFDERGYGDIFVASVNAAVEQLVLLADSFAQVFAPYETEGNRVLDVAEVDVLAVPPASLASFFSIAETVYAAVEDARAVSAEVSVLKSQVPLQFPDEPVDWYLNIQEFISRGRPEFRDEEGIQNTFESAYLSYLDRLSDNAITQADTLYEQGLAAVATDRYDVAGTRFATALSVATLLEQSYAATVGVFPDNAAPIEAEQLPGQVAGLVVDAQALQASLASLEELSGPMTALVDALGARINNLASFETVKEVAEGVYLSLQDGSASWRSTFESYEAEPSDLVSESTLRRLAEVSTRWETTIARVAREEAEVAAGISQLTTAGSEELLPGFTERLTAAEPLVEGVLDQSADAELARTVRFPDRALATFGEISAELTTRIAQIVASRERLENDSAYIQDLVPIVEEYARLDRLQNRIQIVLTRADEGAAEATALIAQSDALIADAQQRIADARAAISQLQVPAARANWNDAREAYVAAFDLREDTELRAEADAIVQDVGVQIREAENILVVRRVRELLTAANTLYTQDEYVSARDTLLEAQQTWEQTNVTDNVEIQRLLQLVTAALSLDEGRELTITDPLYPVLGNYLSIAREDFNRGLQLFEAGSAERATVLFDRAIENLENVRAVRPLNWDARLLELRITQIQNEDDFDEVFAARYRQAVAGIDDFGPLQAYGEIEVLAEINPDFPGIQEQLRQLEIALNLRPDPVTQARRGESAQLFSRAQTLAQSAGQDAAAAAVTLLEQAVELDPTNGNAAFLLDQLRIRLGGQATVALTTADELQYRRAETLFSQGRVLQALSIAEQLLQTGQNNAYPPLVDLRRRIGLRLGI